MEVVAGAAPTEREWGDLLFAWRVVKHVRSNAIVIARDTATVGIGAGQMSRVDSTRLALGKALTPVAGAVLASDAFFPFADGVQAALDAGVRVIIEPGGSKRDDEVIAAVEARRRHARLHGPPPLLALSASRARRGAREYDPARARVPHDPRPDRAHADHPAAAAPARRRRRACSPSSSTSTRAARSRTASRCR